MHTLETVCGITNIACGLLFVLVGIPLAKEKVPMNRFYGFRIAKAFVSDDNWYAINRYGGEQLLRWSVLLFLVGVLYFIFPIAEPRDETASTLLAVAPIVVCATMVIFKTMVYAGKL